MSCHLYRLSSRKVMGDAREILHTGDKEKRLTLKLHQILPRFRNELTICDIILVFLPPKR